MVRNYLWFIRKLYKKRQTIGWNRYCFYSAKKEQKVDLQNTLSTRVDIFIKLINH